MRRAIRKSAELFVECFEPDSPVVEMGSRYLEGWQWLCDLRPLFPNHEFAGCDVRPGLGVDRIEDAQAMARDDGSVATMLMFEVLEHVPHPEKALREVRRVLRPDGLLAMSVPCNYRLHGFPDDYRRLTPSGVHIWLEGFAEKAVFGLGPRVKPAFVFAVATPRKSEEFLRRKAMFQARVVETFRASLLRGWVSAMKERGRDLLGCLLGRADLGVAFYEPESDRSRDPENLGPSGARPEAPQAEKVDRP